MPGTLPQQHPNSQTAAFSIAADNLLRTKLEEAFAAAVGKGVIAGGAVTQTAAFAVEVATATILFCEGVSVTLAAAAGYSGLTPSTTNYLWATITRTARDRSIATAVDTWALVLSHNTTGTAPSATAIPLATIVCDGAGITSISDPATGKYLDGNPATAEITVGTETTDVIGVTVQVKNGSGGDYAGETAITAYLVDSASKTAALTGTAPNGGWAAGTGRLRRTYTANKDAAFVTASNGAVRIDLTHTGGAGTWYLVVELGGRMFLSGAITFA